MPILPTPVQATWMVINYRMVAISEVIIWCFLITGGIPEQWFRVLPDSWKCLQNRKFLEARWILCIVLT